MGFWITVLIIFFVLGSVMGLKPSAHQKALGLLRERGRILGLQPKLIPCPDWLINTHGEKGKGMVALYGMLLPEAKLPRIHALVIDDIIQVVTGKDVTLTHEKCDVEDALGITIQANFVGVYIKESLYPGQNSTQNIDKRLNNIKENLQKWAKTVQA